MEAGFNQLRRGGTLALVGAGVEQPTFDPNRFILNELHVVGSFVYDQGGFERALELLASDGFPSDLLIEAEDVPLDGMSDALVGLAEGRFAGKVMVVPRLSEGAAVIRPPGGVMAHPFYPTGNPRFNHVAMSLDADLLDEANREDICRFWSEVFGFDELEVMTEDRRRLVLSCVHWDQFIFLVAEDEPDALPPHGPLRLCRRVDGRAAGRAGAGRGLPPTRTTGSTSSTCTSTTRRWSPSTRCTCGYLLPMMCEVQWWEFAA